jgi:hypothetical protein
MIYDDRSYEFVKDDFIHKNDLPTEKTRDYLEGLKEALYKTGDIKNLEHCLEELCALYEVKFEDKEPIISMRIDYLHEILDSQDKKLSMFSKHIEDQRKIIDKLMGR